MVVSQTGAMGSFDQTGHHFEMMVRFHAQLSELPAQFLEHHSSFASFGSWWSIIRYKGVPFRIVYDGRDRGLVVEQSEAANPPYAWNRVVWRQIPATEEDLLGSQLLAAIRAFASAG